MILLGATSKVNKTNTRAIEMRVQTALAGMPRPIGWGQNRLAGNLLGYYDFQSKKQKQGGKGGLAGGGGKGGGTTYTYSAAVIIGICEGPVSNIIQAWNSNTKQSLSSLNLDAYLGSYSQMAAGYMATNHPSSAFAYRGIAYCTAFPLSLGSNPALPNLTYEVLFGINSAWSGVPDANPKDVITDVLTNIYYGVNFPAANIGNLAIYGAYCCAAGIAISPVLTSQRALNTTIQEWLAATNSDAFFSGGILNITPYGDQNLSANGATYTAPSEPLFDIDDSDFLVLQASGSFPSTSLASSTDRVQIARSDPTKLSNIVSVGFIDRASDYNHDTVQAQDDASIADNGPRADSTVQCDFFCLRSAALMSAQLMLGRKAVRRQFQFTVGRRYILLDPMDIVTLTSATQGLSRQWVRIREITENQDKTLTVIAEEYLAGTGSAPEYGTEANVGHIPDYNADPGNALAPAVFDAPVALAKTIGLETFIATAGSSSVWGGAELWVSTDGGATYYFEDEINAPSRIGVLSATLASGSDPDTTNTLSVDLTESSGDLDGGTQSDADRGITICLVDGEYIAYEQATLTSTYKYDLGTHGANAGYLRRGVYGSAIASHAAGSTFVRIDDNVLRLPYTKDNVGQTIYFKLLSFNLWGGGKQTLDAVTAYQHTIGGPPVDYGPSDLVVVPSLRSNKLTWVNPPLTGVVATEIWRNTSSTFTGATHIDDVAGYGTSYVDIHVTTGATYYYWVRTRDVAGGLSVYNPLTSSAGVSGVPAAVGNGDIGSGAVTSGPGGNLGGEVDTNHRPAIDFSWGSHQNKILDYIGDGTDYIRMPELGVYGVGTNRRAFIDFTSGYHLNKNLDNIADGSSFSRIQGANVYNSTPLIDFAQSRHLNKNLDNIADGASFSRIQGSNVYNSAPLIDFAQSRHLNKNLDNIADGTTYARIESSRVSFSRPLIDFSEGIHLNKNLDNIADGSTYMRLGANRVTAQHLQSGLSTSGATLNLDPACTDVTAWNRYSTPLMMTGVGAAPSGSTALTYTTGASGEICSSKNIPVNLNQTYRVEMSAGLNGTVGATAYLFVAFFDASGNLISGAPVTGWGGTGSFYYFGLVNGVVPSVWTTYSFTFGPGGQGQIPSNAKFMAVGAILNANNTAGAQVFLTNVRLTQNISLDDGVTDGNTFIRLGVNRVQYAHLQNNAATTLGISVGGALTTTSAWQTVNSFTVTMRGVPVKLDFGATVQPASAPSFGDYFTWQILEDGITFASSGSPIAVNGYQHVPIIVTRTPSAGAHTYTIQAKTGAGPAVSISDAGLTVSELAK